MKLTIIRSDKFVAIDGVGYAPIDLSSLNSDIHAVQWYGTHGEIEYVLNAQGEKPVNTLIDSIEQFSEIIQSWTTINTEATTPKPPTSEELKADCEMRAKRFLTETDWSQLPDVEGILGNKQEFDAYRADVRVYAVAPVESPVWPVRPTPVWLN